MGERNNALKVYMGRPDRIRSVLEYCLGEKLPEDWACRKEDAFLTVRNPKGKLSFRERDYLGSAQAWGVCFLLGIENQDTVNSTFPWRLMEMDCLTYGREIREIQDRNIASGAKYGPEDDFKYDYRKSDSLKPIVNLMLYWGKNKWTEHDSLRSMMDESQKSLPEKFLQMVGNYHVYIVQMRFLGKALPAVHPGEPGIFPSDPAERSGCD